jgi:hypothetical protein
MKAKETLETIKKNLDSKKNRDEVLLLLKK